MALPKLPLDMKSLAKAGQIFEGESNSDTIVEILVDTSARRELITRCRKMLAVQPGSIELAISGFQETMPPLAKEAGLTIVIGGNSQFLRRIMEISLWSNRDFVVLTEDAAALVATVPEEDALDIARNIIEVSLEEAVEVLEHDLSKWCIRHVPKLRITLGVAFPFMRRAIAQDLTFQTALQNAAIAAIFFLPGADLPALTLNQCKLLYQIAVINEVPLTRERLVEVALVVGSAFGLRSATRFALKKLTPIGWLVRGSTAFGATIAMGHLANELYRQGGGVVEMVKGSLPEKESVDEAMKDGALVSRSGITDSADSADSANSAWVDASGHKRPNRSGDVS